MTKLAYLIGASGVGKSVIGNSLVGEAQLVEIDKIHRRAVSCLPPDESGDESGTRWYSLENWAGDRMRNAPSVLAGLIHENWPDLSNARPILAEGTILGVGEWRISLDAALSQRGIIVTDKRVFWLDPPPDICWEWRTQKRRRKSQRDESKATVAEHLKYYQELVCTSATTKHENSDDMKRALWQFFRQS